MNFLVAVAFFVLALGQAEESPVASAHRKGPHHLEGWTMNGTLPDHPGEQFPVELVIARRGRVILKIDNGPFVWDWMFVDDGKRVAYEAGSLHFNDDCVLQDLQSRKILRHYDCYRELPANAPGWVRRLKAHKPDPAN